ncbi:MAG: CvpA family protein [Lachnospiraceae bacterium]|nr:CvpA family protein [Lachnospiraceae bacterium]
MDIAEFMQEHWLSVLMVSYFVGMMLYGHYRGFLRLSVSMAAIVISLVVVRTAMPQVTTFVKENAGIHQWMQEMMTNASGLEQMPEGGMVLPAEQRAVIEGTSLPESVKKALIENNNEEIYQILGVDVFADYVGSFLADRIINTLAFVILFLAVYISIRVLAHFLDLVARLPVLYGLNQIAGAVLGLIQAFIYFWVFCLVLNLFVSTGWGQYLLDAVEETPWVSFLYHNNLLSKFLLSVIWNLL